MTDQPPWPGSEPCYPAAPPLTVPGVTPYIFLSWRDALAAAHAGIANAQEHRRRTFRAAADAGLTRREIGEATGLSTAGVQRVVGKGKRTTLDSKVRP